MTRRRTYATIAAMLAFLAVMLAAELACAPAAPPGQNGAGGAAADTEATATATPAITRTPTPTWQAEVSPLVNAVMVKQATIAAAGASGAVSGQADARPQTINVIIYIDAEQSNDVEQLLADNQVTVLDKSSCGEVCINLNAEVPVSLLSALSVHPDVSFIDTIKPYYKQLDEYLNLIIADYDAGLITEQEVVARIIAPHRNGRILIVVDVDTEANAEAVINFLEDNDVYVSLDNLHTIALFVALVPVPLILPLSQQPGILYVGPHFLGYDNDNPEPHIEEYMDALSPPSASSSSLQQVSEAAVGAQSRTPTPTPTPTWQAEVSPLVNAVMVKQATIAAAGASGAVSGQADARPQTINVIIYIDAEQSNDVEQLLADNQVTVPHKYSCGEMCISLDVEVPVSLLSALSMHPAVGFIDTIQEAYYKQLDEYLNPIVAQYDAGLITEEEAVAQTLLPHWENRILVTSDFDNPANARNAHRYLENNGVYLAPHPADDTVVGGLIPFRLILPFSQQKGAVFIAGIGYGADLTAPETQEYLNQYKPPLPARR